MALTLLDQLDDMLNSETYDDTVTPSEANYETNQTRIEGDLNSLRSSINNLLNRNGASFPADNWWDDLAAPVNFENGTQRGLNVLNQGLHDVERKRVLRDVKNLTDVTVPASQNYVVLALSELPSNTTAALGLVTTLGTVAAEHTGTFGSHSLDEVPCTCAVNPRNLMEIVDGSTRDPILSDGRRVYGLLQTENGTDGHTMTGTTPNRAQISFVRINATGDDIEAVPVVDIENAVINYATRERVGLEDLIETDFLKGATTDTPSGVGVTRQGAYNGQGATPVDVTTNSTLDLEGPGLTWTIRDDLEAMLFELFEGSAAGTSEVRIGAAVDVFNNDAVDNDFANGASFDTAGTPIQVAETAGLIERADTLRLYASGASAELLLDDSFLTAEGTWTGPGIPLSSSTAEVADFVTEYGDGTSILAAINAAAGGGNSPTFHVNSSTVPPNTDCGGPGTTGAQFDVDFPDALTVGTFTSNHLLWVNGRLMRPGANASANFDYYPGTDFIPGNVDLRFERRVRNNSTIAIQTL
jgi:hypothetical protein